MARGKSTKKENKALSQPVSGKVEKASSKKDKGPQKGVEKVAQKAKGKDVKIVAKSVPKKTEKKQPKKEKKSKKKVSSSESSSASSSSSSEEKVVAMEESSSSSGSSSSGSGSSSSGSSSSGSGSGSSSSGSSSSGSGSSSSGSSSSGSESGSGSSSSGSSGSSDESSEEKKDTKKDKKRKTEETETAAPPAKKQKTEGEAATNGGDYRVKIENLVFTITDEDVHKFFSDCGTITTIEWEEERGRFAGRGVITFSSDDEVQKAVAKNGADLMGRRLRASKFGATPAYQNARPVNDTPATTLFLMNLSYEITEDDIRGVFESVGEPISIRFPAKGGTAFVEFADLETSAKGFETGNGVNVRGRAIRLEYAQSRGSTPIRGGGQNQQTGPKSPKPEGGCTMFIGGLPNHVEEKDINNAFEGMNIANVRWVEKDGQFKGVAFVEFADTETADKAMAIAPGSVIAGRNIRVDWAADSNRREKRF